MISIEVEAPKIPEQVRKLREFNRTAERHFRQATGEGTSQIVVEWKKIAPVRLIAGGSYRKSIAGQVKQVSGEIVGIASTNVRERGFPYPAALEQSPRYHYRSGPRRGQKTQHHARDSLKRTKKTIVRFFQSAVDRILRDLQV